MRYVRCAPLARRLLMSMTEVVEESLKASERFRNLTVLPTIEMQVAAYFGWKRKEDRDDQG